MYLCPVAPAHEHQPKQTQGVKVVLADGQCLLYRGFWSLPAKMRLALTQKGQKQSNRCYCWFISSAVAIATFLPIFIVFLINIQYWNLHMFLKVLYDWCFWAVDVFQANLYSREMKKRWKKKSWHAMYYAEHIVSLPIPSHDKNAQNL